MSLCATADVKKGVAMGGKGGVVLEIVTIRDVTNGYC